MALSIYTPENCRTVLPNPHGRPRLSVTRAGRFIVNKSGVLMLQLKKGDQLVVLQDSERPADWYLARVKKGGFSVRPAGSNGLGTMMFNNSKLACRLIDTILPGQKRCTLPIANEAEDMETDGAGTLSVIALLTAMAAATVVEA